MPFKSVREMTGRERRHYALASRTFRAAVAMTVVLGLAAIAIIFAVYIPAMNRQYANTAYNVSAGAAALIRTVADPASCVDRVMTIYRDLPEEVRLDQRSEAYRNSFRTVTQASDHRQVYRILHFVKENNDIIDDVYLSYYDRETSRVIYIVDPDTDPETRCPPGTWESLSQEELELFLSPAEGEKPSVYSRSDQYGWLLTSGVPITGWNGEVVGLIQTDISVWNLVSDLLRFLVHYILVLAVTGLLMSWFFVRYLKKILVRPVDRIAEAAETYVKDRRSGSDITDHFSREVLNITTGDEVENLSLVMADMEREMREYEDHIGRETAEKERISTELTLASRIQAHMLPNIFPPFPDRTEFDIYALMDPAKEVGGDFYDFFLVDEDHLGLVMADVSGKGIPAALFMMASKIQLNNSALTGLSPARVLETVNDQICRNNREEMFVTVWLGVLDIQTGVLTAASAGHEYPVIRQGKDGFALFRDKHGFVVGGMEGMKYADYEIRMQPGDRLFVYTDGVVEATNGEKTMFGTERMLAALNRDPEASPEAILKNVAEAVDAFVQEAPQFDDMTMLCLEYIGTCPPEGPDRSRKDGTA